MRGIRATITGRVQGVGFRCVTRRTAADLGLSGWVRNRPDGSVEVWAQGIDEAIANLLRFLHQGPPGAIVLAVEVDEVPTNPNLEGFEIEA